MSACPTSRVDVICSVYNPRPDFQKTVQSVLNQSYRGLSLVIIDDGSTIPAARGLLEDVAQLDLRITVIYRDTNVGLTRNLHEQVQCSKADYIARIDAGDYWSPEKLSRQVDLLENCPGVIIVGTQCVYVDESNKEVGRSWFAEQHQEIMNAIVNRRGVFEHSSIMFRRSLNYRPEFKMSQDLDLYLRASSAGELYCLNEVMTYCQINRSGLTIQKRYLQRKYQELAYSSHYAVTHLGKEVDLKVNDSAIERRLWSFAQPFYIGYVTARTEKRSPAIWLSLLLLTILIFPPLAKDYLKKISKIHLF
jgi:glycosyltransferase involved in cell wall biosynthesis